MQYRSGEGTTDFGQWGVLNCISDKAESKQQKGDVFAIYDIQIDGDQCHEVRVMEGCGLWRINRKSNSYGGLKPSKSL